MRCHHKKYDIYNSVVICRKTRTYFLTLILFSVSFNGFSQNTSKKNLTANDYTLWGYLNADKLSENGKWASFYINYQTGADTLFVKNSKGTKTYSFSGASRGEFIAERYFLMMSSKDELKIVDLLTSKEEIVKGALRYEVSADNRNIIILKKLNTGKKQLELKNIVNGKSIITNGVDLYWYNPKADIVVYTTKTEKTATIALLNLHDNTTTIVATTTKYFAYSDLAWQKNGNSIAFLEQPLNDKEKKAVIVWYYTVAKHKLYASMRQRKMIFL